MPARKRVPLISPFAFALCMFIMPICSLLLAAQPGPLREEEDETSDPTPSVVEPAPASTSRPSPDDIPPVRPTDEIAPVRPDDEIAPMGGAVNAQPDVPPPGADGPLDGSDSPADSPAGEDYATLKPGCRFRYSYKCDTGTFHLTEKGGTAHYVMPDGRRNLVMLDRPSLGNPCRACRDNPAKEFDLPPFCAKFIYFVPDPGCDDTSICAWAFSRSPCGCKGHAVMKCIYGKWYLHCWARRDTMCDTCFPPNPPNCPTCPPPCNSCHHHPCCCLHWPPQNPCWSSCCWPIRHCRRWSRRSIHHPVGFNCGYAAY